MTIATLRGIPVYTVSYTVKGSNTSPVATDTSVVLNWSSPASVKRKKPSQVNLIWDGTTYSKTRHVWKYEPFVVFTGQKGDGSFKLPFARCFLGTASLYGMHYPKTPPEPVDPMNRLLNKFRADVANIATMLGEYKDTVRLVVHNGNLIIKSADYARRGFWRAAFSVLGKTAPTRIRRKARRNPVTGKREVLPYEGYDLPACWLQWKLGIKPLVDDIEKSVDEITGRLEELPPTSVVRHTATSRTWIHQEYLISSERYCLSKGDIVRHVVGYAEIDNLQLKAMSDHGLTSVSGLIWELTWLSFVVDYVYNVSEWLQALDTARTFSRSIAYETRKVRMSGIFRAVGGAGLGSAAYPYKLESPANATCDVSITSRTKRSLTAVRPQWNPRGGVERLATLSSLALVLSRKLRLK